MTKARDLANGGFGLVLIKPTSVVNGTDNGKGTVSFSAQTSVSLNGVFNSTYKNYRFIFTWVPSAQSQLIYRWRIGTSDQTGATYQIQNTVGSSTSVSGGRGANGTSAEIAYQMGGACMITGDIIAPFSSDYKSTITTAINWSNTTVPQVQNYVTGWSGTNSNFDGITFYPSTGNITGSVQVYGYNN